MAQRADREQKFKQEAVKPKWIRHVYPEAVPINPAERVSYATILKELKKRVKPEELRVTIQRIRETL